MEKMYEVYINGTDSLILTCEKFSEEIGSKIKAIISERIKKSNNKLLVINDIILGYNDGIMKVNVELGVSDSLINHDTINDDLKKIITIEIHNVSDDEYYQASNSLKMKSVEENVFDPFADDVRHDTNISVGIFNGCVKFLAQSYCNKRSGEGIERYMDGNYTLMLNNPKVYMTTLLQRLTATGVKKTASSSKVIELMYDIYQSVVESGFNRRLDDGTVTLYTWKTFGTLQKMNKITALLYYRKKLGKSQKEIADEIGISLRQYQRYESMNSTLHDAKMLVIEKVAQVLGVEVKDIYDGYFVKLKEIHS